MPTLVIIDKFNEHIMKHDHVIVDSRVANKKYSTAKTRQSKQVERWLITTLSKARYEAAGINLSVLRSIK